MLKTIILTFLMSAAIVLPADNKPTGKLICPQKNDPPPVIDANINEWLALPGEITVNASHVKWGKAKWENEDDLSGSFRICWDQNYLYVLAEVIDDKLLVTQSGAKLYQTDHIEIDIDTDYQPGVKGPYTNKQFVIAIAPGNMEDTGDPLTDIGPEFYIYNPVDLKLEQNIDIAAKATEDGYIIEARIPWKILGVKPAVGVVLGIDLHLSDSDDSEDQETLTTLHPGPWPRRDRSKVQPVVLTNAAGR